MKNLYLHFYRDTRLKNKNALGAIDSTSQLLLHLIAVKKIDNKPMTVTGFDPVLQYRRYI